MVAAVTFSGGEEIGIYASIFAIYHNVSEIVTIFILVMIFTGIWCIIALYLSIMVSSQFTFVNYPDGYCH
jgi:cadmium resistance protein CadD (predicted permease)